MDVIIRAPMYDPSGYALVARQLAINGYLNGINTLIKPLSTPGTNLMLSGFDTNILKKCEQTPINQKSPLLNICIANGFVFDKNRVTMGMTMLESDGIIPEWVRLCNNMDAVLVPTTFNYHTFANSGVDTDKIKVFPLGVNEYVFSPIPTSDDELIREQYLPKDVDDDTLILFSNFEWIGRKNPDILLQAYCNAFKHNDNVLLMLKVYNNTTAYDPKSDVILTNIKSYLNSIGCYRHPRIIIVPTIMSEEEIATLYRLSDCYVTPTSGEGWSLPINESLATGKPAIATNWSGYLDFLNDDNGYLVEVEELVDVPKYGKPSDPLYEGTKWAKPSVESLTEIFKHVYNNREEMKVKGQKGRELVLQNYTWGHAVLRLKKLLTIADDVLSPPKRHVKVTEPKLNVGVIVPSLEKPVCGIKEYTLQLKDGIGDRANIVLVSNSYTPDNREKLKNCSILNYQFEYSLYEKYFLERELAMIKDKLVSVTLHSYSSGLWAENRMLADYSDQIIVHAKDMMNRFSITYKDKLITIPHGCDTPVLQEEEYNDGKLHVGTFGIANPHKGIIELMLAMKELQNRKQEDVILHMYSTIAADSNNSILYAEHVEDILKVHEMEFVDWHVDHLPRTDIIKELSKCNMLVLPYFNTGQDYAISGAARTAMAALRPIILSDAFCFSDLFKVTNIIPQHTIASPYAFANAIHKLYTSDLFDIEKLRQYVNRNSWHSAGTKYLNAWQNLINKNRRN